MAAAIALGACGVTPPLSPSSAGAGGAAGSTLVTTADGAAGTNSPGGASGASGRGGANGGNGPGGASGGNGPGGAGGGSMNGPYDPTADPNCQISPAAWHQYSTEADLDALLVRRWKRCNSIQLPGEDVGVEFTADGHIYPLTWAADGSVVRRTGTFEGSWLYYPVGSSIPDLETTSSNLPEFKITTGMSGSEYTSAPQITDDPRQMRVLFSPVPSKYVPLDPMPGDDLGMPADDGGGPIIVGDASEIVDPAMDPNCAAAPASNQSYSTAEELQALLVGPWKSCWSGTSAADLGLDFTADGRFYPLTYGPNGSIVRRTGVDFASTWQYLPVGATDPTTRAALTRPVLLINSGGDPGIDVGDEEVDAPQLTNAPRQLLGVFGFSMQKLVPLGP
jgi:hypothetical protein